MYDSENSDTFKRRFSDESDSSATSIGSVNKNKTPLTQRNGKRHASDTSGVGCDGLASRSKNGESSTEELQQEVGTARAQIQYLMLGKSPKIFSSLRFAYLNMSDRCVEQCVSQC